MCRFLCKRGAIQGCDQRQQPDTDEPATLEELIGLGESTLSGLLLVVETDRTVRDELDAACRELARVEPIAARVILNRAV